jgi:hypothetical protein
MIGEDSIYKAMMAKAAAPRRPAAWVARAAAPGNSETEGEADGTVPLEDGVG